MNEPYVLSYGFHTQPHMKYEPGVTERIRRNIENEEHAHAYYCRNPVVIRLNLSALQTKNLSALRTEQTKKEQKYGLKEYSLLTNEDSFQFDN